MTGAPRKGSFDRPVRVGALGEYPHTWSWVYYHGIAEAHVAAHNNENHIDEAPDLVSAEVPIDQIDDGEVWCNFHGEIFVAYLWSVEAVYRTSGVSVRRRGLIVQPEDFEADNYARACRETRKNHL